MQKPMSDIIKEGFYGYHKNFFCMVVLILALIFCMVAIPLLLTHCVIPYFGEDSIWWGIFGIILAALGATLCMLLSWLSYFIYLLIKYSR